MPVVFGPTLRRLAGDEKEPDGDEPPDRSNAPVTARRVALGALAASVAAWFAARRLRRRDRDTVPEKPAPK
ncbi:hypothetical protein [Haloglomus litoreum]|uniref:hypothetical protein n=1 Tax=Haloglomus litoreum TaxID=3034026 RepID=UPI0023E81B99|nr:hypothetical protein [Haloglomus sp. DT116]